MAAYLIADTKITDPEGYEKYKALARPIAESFGGMYLARGGEMHVADSELWSPVRVVIIQFDSMEQARAFVDSDEYAPVAAMRHKFADSTVVLVDAA